MPPSRTGKASRHSRSTRPRATAATVIGLRRSRGWWWCSHGMPITSASSGSGTRTARRATPRRSASACATDGGPANAAAAVTSRASPCRIRRRSPPGRRASRCTGERTSVSHRLVVVGIAAHAPGEARRIEDERRADHRHPRRQQPLQCECDLPAARRRGLEQRVGPGAAENMHARGPEKRTRATVEHRLGRGHRHDEVGLDEQRMHS